MHVQYSISWRSACHLFFKKKEQGLEEFEGEQWGGTLDRVSHDWGQLLLRMNEVLRNHVADPLGLQVHQWLWE